MQDAQQYPPPSPANAAQHASPVEVPRKATLCTIQAIVAASLTAALLVLLAAIVLSVSNSRQPVSVTDTPSCCLRETEWLFYHVNISVNPCIFLHDYVCGVYREQREPPAFGESNYSSEKELYLYRPPPRKSGIAVYRLFQSCLSAVANIEKQGGSTATTYIGALLPNTAVTKSKRDLLLFLLQMAVRYNIMSHPVVALYGRGGFPSRVFFENMHLLRKPGFLAVLLLTRTAPSIRGDVSDQYHRLRKDCLQTINRMLNLSVNLKNMEDLERDLDVTFGKGITANDFTFGNAVLANFSDVDKLAPSLTMADWSWAVRNVSGSDPPAMLFHSSVDALRKTFGVLLDVRRREVTLVFFIFKAVTNFLLEMLNESGGIRSKRRFLYCKSIIYQYSPLMLVNKIETYSREHAAVFHRIFKKILAEIAAQTARIMPPTDHTRLLSYHKNLRLLLPSDLLPAHKKIPSLTGDFVRNLLTLFRSGWSNEGKDLLPGITEDLYKNFSLRKIGIFNDTIVIPVFAYTIYTFHASDELVVPSAIIGVPLADALWKNIFSEHEWSTDTSKLLDNYTACQVSLGTLVTTSLRRFHVPLLSIETARRVAVSSLWQSQFESFGGWRVSRCKLFYMLLMYHHYCPAPLYFKERFLKEAQYIALISEDFRDAFKCQAPLNTTPTCRLEQES
ncbi:hypothetical protein HPB48_026779 [Haemaphysalis longicornis]|uniref:Uncharacterized protein n=1 Tax=Haemaphysalis longicornis TaxID=44386 RepID=A0A9J6HAC7_HAELO|nr:hypothetical protein HPB48_026779 [Haemaphysalis longicornis]